jgi:hypothetical protein
MAYQIVDVWIQHPTLRHSRHEMFDSLRRWAGAERRPEEPLPLEVTISALDEGQVGVALTAAWYGPEGSLISNEEVSCGGSSLRARFTSSCLLSLAAGRR